MAITVTVKRQKRLNGAAIVEALFDEQMKHALRATDLYETSVYDWTNAPDFSAEYDHAKKSVNIYARGQFAAIYAQLERGYQRQVAVSGDWMSKTQPGILHSRPGRGHVLRHSNRKPVLLQSPEPVLPRLFTAQVAEQIRYIYFASMMAIWKRQLGSTHG